MAGGTTFDWVLILSIPLILLAANDEWLFPYGNPTDAWINIRYFFETGHDFPPLYTTYKATRLSWILKGLLAHSLFPPLTAHYVLHLATFGALLALFYVLVRKLTNRHVAVLGTIAFGTYSQFHAVISFEWDYETHDGVLNVLLTLLFLLLAARGKRWRMWLLLAGAAWASALQATYTGTFIPAMAFWYLYLNHKRARNPIPASILYLAIGSVSATLLYCVASYLLGGPFFFFLTLIQPIRAFGFAGGFNFHPGYWQPVEYLLQHSKGLVVPLFATGVAVLVLALVRLRRNAGPAVDAIVLTQATLLVAAATHLLFHLIGHGHLSNDHMLAYMTPFVFLALSGGCAYLLLVSGLTVPANAARVAVLKIVVFVMFTAALILGLDTQAAADSFTRVVQGALGVPVQLRNWHSIFALTLLLQFAVVGLLFGLGFARRRPARTYVAVLCLSAFLAVVNVRTASIAVASYDWRYACGFYRDHYAAVIETFQKIRPYYRDYDLGQWYRNNELVGHPRDDCGKGHLDRIYGKQVINMTELYGAVLGMRTFTALNGDRLYLVDRYLSTPSFAKFSNRRLAQLPPAFRAVVFARDPKDHETALNTLRLQGFRISVLNRSHVEHGAISFDITILDVRRDDRLRAKSRM